MDKDLGNVFEEIFGGTFGGVFDSTSKSYQDRLDQYWLKDIERYYKYLNDAKAKGYKVYRNSEGKHKVVKK